MCVQSVGLTCEDQYAGVKRADPSEGWGPRFLAMTLLQPEQPSARIIIA